jgi:hypothetical protein
MKTMKSMKTRIILAAVFIVAMIVGSQSVSPRPKRLDRL